MKKIPPPIIVWITLLLPVAALPAAGCSLPAWLIRIGSAAGMALTVWALAAGKWRYWLIPAQTAAIAFLWLECLEFFSFLITGESFSFQFYYHFNLDTLRHGASGYRLLGAGAAALLLAASALLAWQLSKIKPECRHNRLIAAGLGLLLLAGCDASLHSLVRWIGRVHVANAATSVSARQLAEFGIKAVEPDRRYHAGRGKNLILIYLESMEAAYLDETLFPGLLPNIKRLINEEAIVFTNIHEARNANFTLGGMYSSMTGSIFTDLHLVGERNPASFGCNGFDVNLGGRLRSFPEILRDAGYFQALLVGTDPAFAGMNVLLNKAGYHQVFSTAAIWRELGENNPLIDPDWGMRDRVLFKAGLHCFRRLTAAGIPFNLTLVTVDGHHPDGITEPDGPKYRNPRYPDSNLLNALHAMDFHLGNFIAELKQTPDWPNTVLVAMTDHLAKRNTLYPVLSKVPDRKLIFFALDGSKPRRIDTPGKTFDVAPTVLDLLGTGSDYPFPLGESLLGKTVNPLRLRGDSAEAEPSLAAYLKQMSGGSIGDRPRLEVLEQPFPNLKIDNWTIPLFREWGVQQFPVNAESIVIALPQTGEPVFKRYDNAATLATGLQPGMRYAILCAPGAAGALVGTPVAGHYYLLFGKPGHWQAAHGETPLLRLEPR